jgi:uncharacterized membrane protein
MFSSTFPLLRRAIMGILLLFSSGTGFGQDMRFENYELEPVLVNMSILNIDVLIVNDLKLGAANSGAIGLFVDGGTDAFFRDIKLVTEN